MSGLNIIFVGQEESEANYYKSYWGLITIGDFSEHFISIVKWWSYEDYEQQWKEGLKRLISHDVSCLITSAQLSKRAPLVNRWVLYKEDSIVYVQNELLVENEYRDLIGNKPFNLKTCYDFIKPRETETECGQKISEWSFEFKALKVD